MSEPSITRKLPLKRRSWLRRWRLRRRISHTQAATVTGLELPTRFEKGEPGAVAGVDVREMHTRPGRPGEVKVTCIDYCADQVQVQDITDIDAFVAVHRPPWSAVRWINVDGLGDLHTVRALAIKYDLHPLAVEDVLHLSQRPKIEAYDEASEHQARLFIIVRMLQLVEDRLESEQVSIFLGHKTLLTFQERPGGDVWDPVRARLQVKGSRLRQNDASFLAYSLVDAIVDQCFPILEHYGDRLEELEDRILEQPSNAAITEVHGLKRDLLLLRRALWPMREVLNTMHREPHECMSDTTRTYIRDVYDHSVQIIDIIETYREVATALTETYMTAVSTRLNEIMKVLTIIGTIFIPLTFLAGVWGMNFGDAMPETSRAAEFFPWIYPVGFWGLCLATAGALYWWIRRRGWL
ncbi:MAG TPA: magnesium/cobalt transporter CorA [Thermoanaerobaculaceae bacterium]|nr:magnesium/cobalt transporter CorA [Thermoanaerobaculaceae bacterium]HRS16914.1 magnesium/cobalt transporter CorA [Thermoanaerobaculaceae bacterium]